MRPQTVAVKFAAQRLGVSEVTVLRYLDDGTLRGFQLKPRGWWHILKSSLDALEKRMLEQAGQ